jgi:hypothetical protein
MKADGRGRYNPAHDGFPVIGNFIAARVDGFGFQAIGAEDNFSLTF